MRRLPFVAFLFLVACRSSFDGPRTPEETCRAACRERAKACTASDCATGCNLVMDRLAEHEGETVLACVSAASACDLPNWARCATLVGPHADGGPPPPPPSPPR